MAAEGVNMAENGGALRLRRDLGVPIPAPAWPDGFTCRTFLAGDAALVHDLLRLAHPDGRGVPDYGNWWGALSADSEFDPALCFLVHGPEGQLVGAALCWTSAFMKDLAVHPQARGRGIGGNLLRIVFRAFRERGAPAVDLKVEGGNARAIRLYERAEMYAVSFDG